MYICLYILDIVNNIIFLNNNILNYIFHNNFYFFEFLLHCVISFYYLFCIRVYNDINELVPGVIGIIAFIEHHCDTFV